MTMPTAIPMAIKDVFNGSLSRIVVRISLHKVQHGVHQSAHPQSKLLLISDLLAKALI
jgi:hypothetical protein